MVTEILKKPYGRMVIPDPEGGFSAEIVEFPGCIAMGDTAAEALENLEEVAVDWIGAALSQGQEIPEPMQAAGYSGKLVLRMPKSLHQRAALYADRDGVSLNQFIVTCLAEQVGSRARPIILPVQSAATVSLEVNFTNVVNFLSNQGSFKVASGATYLQMPTKGFADA
ncbi:type II toxin-antitoxin system HicB family antitoxin [Mesorhizobium sp. WSM4906]|uniref:type II toxin-antitoxin system HicB family antitoxin n=1 Tax=Mesorhizobium sp. WSM4906 TaxID=3038546 RepID=UPI0024169285|nr:type II toxin-antitoxin system HicB family antitoxin [Mesorhizobium sp. WSM4906]WFP76352.1 toxin-antitoxin system HicB family antitoxin [Mesorhizobium sp. WSM4906]